MKIQSSSAQWRRQRAVVLIGTMGLLVASCGSADSTAVTNLPDESADPPVETENTEVETENTEVEAEVPEPVVAGSRIATEECGNGLASIDGLYEYAPVDGAMLRLDLTTQEITAHGPTVSECAFWLGDETVGRRVGVPQLGDRIWFGPFDGPWETEVETGGDWGLLSRSFTGNRLIFLDFKTFSVNVVDATTGERVGEPIVGGFAPGRSSAANAVSGDGSLLAVGGANPGGANGDGVIFVLDAVSGDRLFEVEVPSPATTMVFDDTANELIVGSFTGEVVTIDLASREIISEVSNSSGRGISALGIRDDGLVVTAAEEFLELIDRVTGPTGAEITPQDAFGVRIRPDGNVLVVSDDDRSFAVYALDK